jgi:hypothetical protein
MTDLLNCPFCDGKPEIVIEINASLFYSIKCTECACCMIGINSEEKKSKMIELWNTRVEHKKSNYKSISSIYTCKKCGNEYRSEELRLYCGDSPICQKCWDEYRNEEFLKKRIV